LCQLGDAFRELESAHKDALRNQSEAESTAQALRAKLSAAETDLQRAELDLRELRERVDQISTAHSAAQRESASLREETDRLRAASAEAKRQHDQEAEALAARVRVETERGIEAFKNSLADKLRLEWRDFDDVSGLAITQEIGASHRRQLGEIFALLERDGIQVKA
jgi:chromosome segregation ATPase